VTRRRVLFGLLALSLLLSLWLALQPQPPAGHVDAAPPRPRSVAREPAPLPPPQRADAGRSAWPEAGEAALAAWSAPPPAPPPAVATAALPPPRRQAPPFPYRWIGRLDDGESPLVLLSGTQRSFGARAGEVLDGQWRIEQIAALGLQVTWLPTGDRVDVAPR
jgi:hypothetical protein